MKAAVRQTYGPPEVLRLCEVDKPVPGGNEVLLEVKAVSLNASDWELLCGKPLYARLFGLWRPKHAILGSDIAGRVEQTGDQVTRFRPGDEVFGDAFGTFGGLAQWVCTPADALTRKPATLTFDEAAAIPQAACIALQGMRYGRGVQSGDDVLINGAGGGAGSFAVQMAKSLGARVTAVDHTIKLEFMRSLGADRVIDYTRENFTRNHRRYDRILDLAAYHSLRAYHRALKPGGVYLMVGGPVRLLLEVLFVGTLLSKFGNKTMRLLAVEPNAGLREVIELIDAGKVRPAIDRCYALEQAGDALHYLGEGQSRGKVVITVR